MNGVGSESVGISCAFATDMESHEHARIAEDLGYRRAYFFDSPALLADVWVQATRAAERTDGIGLGPAVLVPSNRHPMTTAAALSTLVDVAGPDRVVAAVGSGFTARMSMGKRALPWREVERFTQALRALLRGEAVEWDDATMQMLQGPRAGAPRPIEIPILVGAGGPKGTDVARRLGDGVFCTPPVIDGFDWCSVLLSGTVLDPEESPASPRAVDAAGGAATSALHFALEHDKMHRFAEAVPDSYEARYRELDERTRHLALHEGHMTYVNDFDRDVVTNTLMTKTAAALPADRWERRLRRLVDAGATEIVYQPAGSDIPAELDRFARLFERALA